MLSEARGSAGRSRADVAQALAVTRFTIRLWEIGDAVPQRTRLRDVARVYGIDEGELTQAWLAAEVTPKRPAAVEAA